MHGVAATILLQEPHNLLCMLQVFFWACDSSAASSQRCPLSGEVVYPALPQGRRGVTEGPAPPPTGPHPGGLLSCGVRPLTLMTDVDMC